MANTLTILRIIGIIPLCYLVLFSSNNIGCFILFSLLGITDFLDGYIARKYNKISNFGRIADGIADKLLMLSITIVLLVRNVIPYWTLIIFIRETIAIIYAGLNIKLSNKIIKPNIFGKTKTTLHIISIAIVLFFGKWNIFSSIILLIAILLFIPELILVYRKTKASK